MDIFGAVTLFRHDCRRSAVGITVLVLVQLDSTLENEGYSDRDRGFQERGSSVFEGKHIGQTQKGDNSLTFLTKASVGSLSLLPLAPISLRDGSIRTALATERPLLATLFTMGNSPLLSCNVSSLLFEAYIISA